METFTVSTGRKCAFIDITATVAETVAQSGIRDGIVVVFVPHTTAGVTINENADPAVKSDILAHLDDAVPQSSRYTHMEGNSPAHIKASMMGSSVTVLLQDGALVLGVWQGIYLCEFDGPRTRKVHVEIRQ
ncbi:MAG: YjbQ family protein [Planctomycetes bacterium]|nr:YjbQ family protein [Planctomycetota bacterium]